MRCIAMPDLELTSMTLPEDDLASLETFEIVAEIANVGDTATPATFPLQLSVDGEMLKTVDVVTLESGVSTTVELTVGPLEAGSYDIELTLDPDNELVERDEANNSASDSIRVLYQRSDRSEQSGDRVVKHGGRSAAVPGRHHGSVRRGSERQSVRRHGRCGSVCALCRASLVTSTNTGVSASVSDANEHCQLVPTRAWHLLHRGSMRSRPLGRRPWK